MKKIKNLLFGIGIIGSLNIFEKAEGQETRLDSLLKEYPNQIKRNDSLVNENLKIYENDKKRKREIFPEFYAEKVYSKNLCINLNEKIYHVTKKNEKQGINDIKKINNDYEESWLYLPEKQIWYEIGIRSSLVSVQNFKFRVERVLKENPDTKDLIFYHNHPITGFYWPSDGDLRRAGSDNIDFLGYKIVSKIVAKEGVVEYYLNDEGKKLLENILMTKNETEKYNLEKTKYFDIKYISIDSIKK